MPHPDTAALTRELKAEAQRLGFAAVGVCPAVDTPGYERFREWLERGYHGEMAWLPDRRSAYAHPRGVLEGARSLLVAAMPYRTAEPEAPEPGQGRISRYAWGDDYHDVLRTRLNTLADWLRARAPGASVRGVVDTAPLAERQFAVLAGLGWIGKNTLLLNPQLGSWFFLGVLVTDVELEADSPFSTDHCGTCRACLDACPTGAFPQPYVLDPQACISYLTIELRGPIPEPLRQGLGDWVFGCDICQDVCPWNGKSPLAIEPSFRPREGANPLELMPLFRWSDDQFRDAFRHTPLWRTKRRGLLRNAAIVLGNQGAKESVPALVLGLNDVEPLVRGASAWALGRIGDETGLIALGDRLTCEEDPHVRQELERWMHGVR